MSQRIEEKNAESVGKPIVDTLIQLLAQAGHQQFKASFPNLRVFDGQEKFDKASNRVKLLGDNPTAKYLGHLIKPDWNVFIWRVNSENSEKSLMLRTELTEIDGEANLTHLSLKNLYANSPDGSESSSNGEFLNAENAESIGKPHIEKILNALLTSNFELYYEGQPPSSKENLNNNREVFEEAVRVLKPMGQLISFQYLDYAKIGELHTLFWKVQYQKEDEQLLFQIMLSDDDGEFLFRGLGFDR